MKIYRLTAFFAVFILYGTANAASPQLEESQVDQVKQSA